MTPRQYAEWFKRQLVKSADAALDKTAQQTTEEMKRRLPSNRRKTRKALRYAIRRRGDRREARISLKFNRRYRVAGTETERLLESNWHKIRPVVSDHFRTHLNYQIRKISR